MLVKVNWIMKTAKLMGGLGNQMFQYAFVKAIDEDLLLDNWRKLEV